MSDEHPGDDPNPKTNTRGNPTGQGGAPQPTQPGPRAQPSAQQPGQPWGPPQPGQHPATRPQSQPQPQAAPRPAPQQWGPPHRAQAAPPSQQGYPPQQHFQQSAPAFNQHPDPRPFPDAPRDPTRRKAPSTGFGMGIGILVGALVLGLFGGFLGGKLSGNGSSAVSADEVDISSLNLQDLVSVQSVADRVLPAVVKIEAFNAREGSTGSGVVLTEDGEILTNYHVVHAAEKSGELKVYFDDGTAKEAKIIGVDPSTDIALIKASDVSGLKTVAFGSADDIRVGQAVVAVGSPYGLDSTVTAGIISTLNRPVAVPGMDDPNKPMLYPAVQTDAAINPGNSGGALVNIKGELVGMNSANQLADSTDESSSGDLGSIGIGWAIPVDVIEPIVKQLREGGEAKHAWLGIVPDDAEQAGLARGALVDGFTANSPSEKAGVKSGDVIVGIDDRPIAEGLALVTTVLHYQPGDEVTLRVLRSGKEQKIKVKLGEQGDLIAGLDS